MKKICDNILDAIGNTPMVRINKLTSGIVKAKKQTHFSIIFRRAALP